MNPHAQKAADYRALADIARDKALAAALPSVRENEERAALRWEGLAQLEDFYTRNADARGVEGPAASG